MLSLIALIKEDFEFYTFYMFLFSVWDRSIRKDLDRVHSSMDTALAANLAMGSIAWRVLIIIVHSVAYHIFLSSSFNNNNNNK